MKKNTCLILTFFQILTLSTFYAQASRTVPPPQSGYEVEEPSDETDIFAIPFDSSEAEEEQEQKELEKYKSREKKQ